MVRSKQDKSQNNDEAGNKQSRLSLFQQFGYLMGKEALYIL